MFNVTCIDLLFLCYLLKPFHLKFDTFVGNFKKWKN